MVTLHILFFYLPWSLQHPVTARFIHLNLFSIHKVYDAHKFTFPLSKSIQQVSPYCFLQIPPLLLVLCIFGCCPYAGLFAVANFVPLLESRCCHCLAGLRFGCFLRFPRYLRFAKPRYTERTLEGAVSRFTLFASEMLIAWGFTSQQISHSNMGFQEMPKPMATFLFVQLVV